MDLIPAGGVVAQTVEVLGTLLRRTYPVEAPAAVEAAVEATVLGQYTLSTVTRGEGEEIAVGELLVACVVLGTLPLLPCGGGLRTEGVARQ